MQKFKVDTSLFKKISKQFNEKLSDSIYQQHCEAVEEIFYNIVDDYIEHLNMPIKKQKIYYERIIGEIKALILFSRYVGLTDSNTTIKDIEEKVRACAKEAMNTNI